MAAINEVFPDYKCIIGTTRNHAKMKGGISCDRFRVVIPFTERITSLRVFRYNMWLALQEHELADQACKDGARFYYPCYRIRHFETDGELWEVQQKVPSWFDSPHLDVTNFKEPLSAYATLLLVNPIPVGERNTACYRLGKDFCKAGYSLNDAVDKVIASPTYGGRVSDTLKREIYNALRSGYRKVMRANRKPAQES
jgi:hypothetical protein